MQGGLRHLHGERFMERRSMYRIAQGLIVLLLAVLLSAAGAAALP